MRTDERAFLDYADLDVADLRPVLDASFNQRVIPLDLVLQVQRSGKICRPGADKQHIHLDLFAFDHIVSVWRLYQSTSGICDFRFAICDRDGGRIPSLLEASRSKAIANRKS